MYQESISLINSAKNNFLSYGLQIGTGATQPVVLKLQLIGTGAIYPVSELQSASELMLEVKKSLGLNILELASILQVSRPTVYKWIESKKVGIRKKNQERLNSLYEISKAWKNKNIGRLGSYLHRPIGKLNVSLFNLLKSDSLDLNRVHLYLDDIASAILRKRQVDEVHETLLRRHGFKPISKEDMEERLNDIYFTD